MSASRQMFANYWIVLASVFLIQAISAPPASAQAQPGARADRLSADAIEAERRLLFSRMMADPSDLDTAFEYAALSSRAGDLEGAIATLERMLIFAPGLPRLQLELGVLYYRLGAYETANSYFEGALAAPDVPEEVRLRVERYRTGIDRASAPTRFSGAVAVGARYQTNANAAPETRNVSLNGIDFLLDEGAVSSPDTNGFIAGNFRFSHDLESQGDRLEANLATYGSLYAEREELNAAIADLTVGPVFNLERFRIEGATLGVYGIIGGVMLDGDPYLVSGGVGANLAKRFGDGTRVSLRTEYRHEDYRDSVLRPTASLRSGDRYRVEAGLEQQVSANVVLTGALEADRREAETGFHSNTAYGASAGARISFAPPVGTMNLPWTVGVTAGYLRRDYAAPDGISSTVDAQRDHEAFVEATLAVPVADAWTVLATGGYRNVDSNYDMRKFDNLSGTISLLRQF
jgi:tetratricopeptide (TPR) repeat protein